MVRYALLRQNRGMKLLELSAVPIFEQLQIEEALLRLTDWDVCILNYGAPPAIVMGISGDPTELLYLEKVTRDNIPVIRRYSGGGTVVVDENTLFVSFLFQKQSHDFPAFPERIMAWSTEFYQQALGIPSFAFRENDYVIEDRKIGGNAQYIQRTRWIHHTSFLYDFCETRMEYLQMPKKRPTYRGERPHTEFLSKLSPFFPEKELFFERIKNHLGKSYSIEYLQKADIQPFLPLSHRKITSLVG